MLLKTFDSNSPVSKAIARIYASYNERAQTVRGRLDRDVRHPEWTRRLLDVLGAPDRQMYNVAVTGSKGKGSHSILLAGILQRMGFRVGLFTGPHLVDFLERFRIDGTPIPEETFVRLVDKVCDSAQHWTLPEGHYFGPVGLLAAVAVLWFQQEQTDVNVFELGRGALHDDVNQVSHQGAVLTPIFLEHVQELGPSLGDIVDEKLGVLTSDTTWLVSHRQSVDVMGQRQWGAEWFQNPRHRWIRQEHVVSEVVGHALRFENHPEFLIHLPHVSGYMPQNASVAFAAASEVVRDLGRFPTLRQDLDLATIQLPGRLQVVRRQPTIVVDGTIHRSSAQYVVSWIQEQCRLHAGTSVGAILGLPSNKDQEGVMQLLAPHVDWVVLSRAHNPHLIFQDNLETAGRYFCDLRQAPYIEDALAYAQQRLTASDLLLVLGTQSFIGDALRALEVETGSIWR